MLFFAVSEWIPVIDHQFPFPCIFLTFRLFPHTLPQFSWIYSIWQWRKVWISLLPRHVLAFHGDLLVCERRTPFCKPPTGRFGIQLELELQSCCQEVVSVNPAVVNNSNGFSWTNFFQPAKAFSTNEPFPNQTYWIVSYILSCYPLFQP